MPEVFDQRGDLNGQRLFRICRLAPQPEYVKSASSESVYGDDELPLSCFADPGRKQFPIHTKAAAWTSQAFFLERGKELEPAVRKDVANRLKAAADFFGIAEDVAELESAYAKSASDPDAGLEDSDFALVLGKDERRYPLRNAQEVKKAAAYLVEHQDEMPFRYRNQMAGRILQKAAEYGAAITAERDFLERQAGRGWCSAEDAAKAMQQRSTLLRRIDPGMSAELATAAKVAMANPEQTRHPDSLVKLAEVLENIDRQHGFCRDYGAEFRRPDEVLFAVTEKVASQFVDDHCAMTNGSIFKLADLANARLGELRDRFGDEFADSVSAGGLMVSAEKLAELGRTLPRGDADLLELALAQSGVRPILKEAAHQPGWLSQERLQEIAGL